MKIHITTKNNLEKDSFQDISTIHWIDRELLMGPGGHGAPNILEIREEFLVARTGKVFKWLVGAGHGAMRTSSGPIRNWVRAYHRLGNHPSHIIGQVGLKASLTEERNYSGTMKMKIGRGSGAFITFHFRVSF